MYFEILFHLSLNAIVFQKKVIIALRIIKPRIDINNLNENDSQLQRLNETDSQLVVNKNLIFDI